MHQVRRIVARGGVLVLLVLAGCGGGGNDDETAAGTGSGADSQSTTAGPGGTTKKQKARLERPSGAPLGEVIPPGHDAYLMLAQGRCQLLLDRTGTWRGGENPVNDDAFFLYRAAANACLQRWDEAQRDYERLLDLRPSFSGDCDSTNCEQCMRAVRRWLDDVLAVHRRDPQTEVEFVAGSQSSPCPEGVGDPDDESTTTTAGATTSSGRSTTSQRSTTSRSTSTTRR